MAENDSKMTSSNGQDSTPSARSENAKIPSASTNAPAAQPDHVCHHCGKVLTTAHSLGDHIISQHTDKREHLCPVQGCKYATLGFAIKPSLRKHMQSMHPDGALRECDHIAPLSQQLQAKKAEAEQLRGQVREMYGVIEQQEMQLHHYRQMNVNMEQQQAELRMTMEQQTAELNQLHVNFYNYRVQKYYEEGRWREELAALREEFARGRAEIMTMFGRK